MARQQPYSYLLLKERKQPAEERRRKS